MVKKIDARNIPCPGPVIEAKKTLKDMTDGVLEVLVDNQTAVANLTKLGEYLKLNVQTVQLDDGAWQVVFRAEDGAADGAKTQQAEAGRKGSPQRDVVVVLSSERMGEGDPELGTVLLKGFLYALTELEQLPSAILLYNGGVKLAAEGSESVEDLKLLESQGVEIMSCGACLNHYGLSEKRMVGTVTNMYSIAERLTGASCVVKP